MSGKTRKGQRLSLRQREFIKQFIAGPRGVQGIAVRAAVAAGYSELDRGVGTALMSNPAVAPSRNQKSSAITQALRAGRSR